MISPFTESYHPLLPFTLNIVRWLISRNYVYDWMRTLPQEVKPKVFFIRCQIDVGSGSNTEKICQLNFTTYLISRPKAEDTTLDVRMSLCNYQAHNSSRFWIKAPELMYSTVNVRLIPEFLDVQTWIDLDGLIQPLNQLLSNTL